MRPQESAGIERRFFMWLERMARVRYSLGSLCIVLSPIKKPVQKSIAWRARKTRLVLSMKKSVIW